QMSLCLNCRACEAVCPSGVQYGAILEASRAQIEQAKASGALPAQASAPAPSPANLPETPASGTGLKPRPLWQRALRGAVFGGLFRNMGLFRAFSGSMKLYQRSGVQWIARRSG